MVYTLGSLFKLKFVYLGNLSRVTGVTPSAACSIVLTPRNRHNTKPVTFPIISLFVLC